MAATFQHGRDGPGAAVSMAASVAHRAVRTLSKTRDRPSTMVQAWYMDDDVAADQRLPHQVRAVMPSEVLAPLRRRRCRSSHGRCVRCRGASILTSRSRHARVALNDPPTGLHSAPPMPPCPWMRSGPSASCTTRCPRRTALPSSTASRTSASTRTATRCAASLRLRTRARSKGTISTPSQLDPNVRRPERECGLVVAHRVPDAPTKL